MKHSIFSLKLLLIDDYKYPFFLISLLLLLFLPSFFSGPLHDFVSNILFVGLILVSLFLIKTKKNFKRGVVYFIGIVGVGAEFYDRMVSPINEYLQPVFLLILFVYFVILSHELISQVITSQQITMNVILGAFTGYIMMGIIGFFIFRIIHIWIPDSFALSENANSELLYFSYITLTTIGYGDITPISEPARNFAIILGLTGQFYIGILMAIIIGKFLQGSSN